MGCYTSSMQDKIIRDKITKIGKKEMQTRFILVQPLPMPTFSPQATHFRFFTNFVKLFTTSKQPWDSSPLCSRFSQVKRQTVS